MKIPRIILPLLFAVKSSVLFSQLSASGTVKTDVIDQQNIYLFFFTAINNNTIVYEGGQQNALFNWYRFNSTSGNWIWEASGRQISIDGEGGYKLEILQDSTPVDTLYGWAFVPQFTATEIVIDEYLCSGTHFSTKNETKKLIYYNSNMQPVEVDYGFTSGWTGSDGEQYHENSIEIKGPYYKQYHPAEAQGECDYSIAVDVTDRFGSQQNDTLAYCNPIAVKADMEWAIRKGEVLNELHDSITSASAPVEISFTGQGKGAVDAWSWSFALGENETGSSVELNPFYVFTTAGTYTVTYTVSNSECTDFNSSLSLKVEDSSIAAPNVFTPNGDGINDEFRVAYRSIKTFRITITSRWGRKVYESTDPAEGWDGTTGGSPAPAGLYYYYLEAEGYNSSEKHKRDGSIHLIREKN